MYYIKILHYRLFNILSKAKKNFEKHKIKILQVLEANLDKISTKNF